MKFLFTTKNTFRDACIHFFLADVVLAAFLGGSLEFILLYIFRGQALFLFHGLGGIVIEALVTWFSVMWSVRLIEQKHTIDRTDSVSLSLLSTLLSFFAALVILPFIQYFSDISHVTTSYLIVKELLHVSVFYTASILYFSGLEAKSLLKGELSVR